MHHVVVKGKLQLQSAHRDEKKVEPGQRHGTLSGQRWDNASTWAPLHAALPIAFGSIGIGTQVGGFRYRTMIEAGHVAALENHVWYRKLPDG